MSVSRLNDLNFTTADELLGSRIPDWLDEVEDFVEGEQFGDTGQYWIGPALENRIDKSQSVLQNIRKGFIYSNKVLEVISRHLDALITEDPELAYVPIEMKDHELTEEQEKLIQLANNLRDSFFDHNHVPTLIEQAGRTLLYASRSALRLYVPIGQLNAFDAENNPVEYDDPGVAYRMFPQTDIEDAMTRLRVHHPRPDESVCLTDDDLNREICIYKYLESSDILNNVSQPISTEGYYRGFLQRSRGRGKGTERIEVSFIKRSDNGDEITVIKTLNQSESAIDLESLVNTEVETSEDGTSMLRPMNSVSNSIDGKDVGFTFEMGGTLPMVEVYRDRFITDSIISLQKTVNLSLSMVPRNITLAGFLERVITNGMPPGKYENGTYDGSGVFVPSESGKSVRFVPEAHVIGPGTLNFYSGAQIKDRDGTTTMATPGVHYKDPVSPSNIVESKDAAYKTILEEARQLHVLLQGDGSVSGISRVQARAEFQNSLSSTVRQMTALYEWLLMAPLKMAATLSGQAGMFDTIKPQVKIRVNLGPLTPEERKSITDEYTAGLISKQTALVQLGSRDVEAELVRLNDDPVQRLELLQKQIEVLMSMVEQGIDPLIAAEAIGMDEDIAKSITAVDDAPIEQ